ncbi:DUF1211 domain-containing protein [Parvularcula flava]|uniref:DUF1211 domain-containing protein n=1 Tax=Aquisalinus luteolus TaxID=1566827 RepID=A0A8J3A4K4_9PROT|nr:TMEM175 family protein [Aquisalinus luteolus]NHK28578.1 DUF1211 domain-containing protein [Aquisalinus luteolus]GGH98898.1 hypothetical protein GCM10011355_23580 [Aquisalinus luteolus]
MIRQAVTDGLEAREIDHDPHFQWRGRNVTRIENLSDIVFALALGMLVSASSPPIDFTDLKFHLLGIIPVTAGFAILLLVWNMHFVYFRRYGLGDRTTIFLNAILLLLILFIAYPLRFIFDALFSYILIAFGHTARIEALGIFDTMMAGELMRYYAIGYALIFAVYALMYRHALKRADEIGLSTKERMLTALSVQVFIMQIIIASAVAILAAMPPLWVWASFLFFFNWPAGYGLRWLYHRKLRKLEQAEGATG